MRKISGAQSAQPAAIIYSPVAWQRDSLRARARGFRFGCRGSRSCGCRAARRRGALAGGQNAACNAQRLTFFGASLAPRVAGRACGGAADARITRGGAPRSLLRPGAEVRAFRRRRRPCLARGGRRSQAPAEPNVPARNERKVAARFFRAHKNARHAAMLLVHFASRASMARQLRALRAANWMVGEMI